jgi:hypothetical protein
LRLLSRLLCVLGLVLVTWPAVSRAQMQGSPPIFRRFSAPPTRAEGRLVLFEVPVALRPQTDPQAHVTQNEGIGIQLASQPFNRVFLSGGLDFSRMTWTPSDPSLSSATVKTFEVDQDLNFWIGHSLVAGVGIGLGALDSLVLKKSGSFEHAVVPYIPVRLGLFVSLWDKLFVGLRASVTPFFASGVEAGHSHLLLDVGWAY